MFTYISPKCRKLAVFIFLGLNLCLESKTVCVLQHYIVPKLQNSQTQHNQQKPSTHVMYPDFSWKNEELPADGYIKALGY